MTPRATGLAQACMSFRLGCTLAGCDSIPPHSEQSQSHACAVQHLSVEFAVLLHASTAHFVIAAVRRMAQICPHISSDPDVFDGHI